MKPMIIKWFGEKCLLPPYPNYTQWWRMYIIHWLSTWWMSANGDNVTKSPSRSSTITLKNSHKRFQRQSSLWDQDKSSSNLIQRKCKNMWIQIMNKKEINFMKGNFSNGLIQSTINWLKIKIQRRTVQTLDLKLSSTIGRLACRKSPIGQSNWKAKILWLSKQLYKETSNMTNPQIEEKKTLINW